MELPDESVSSRMREDWNRRALEDASYYVAFGRREQDDDEFFSTGDEVVKSVEWELKRFPPATDRRSLRALEIGCGPGRLMRPVSRILGEVHGVDVSDEMVRLAREKLAGIENAHVQATNGASLAAFADESFDIVYSYAVFQHIPSRDVVFEYLRETRRVLKEGGIFRAQFNGLPQRDGAYDTWSGARFTAGELTGFTRDHSFQLLAIEGAGTQYMWTTWRKRPAGWHTREENIPASLARIRRITNAASFEPLAPCRGRYAAVSIWVEALPGACGLHDLEVLIGEVPGQVTYIGPPDNTGLTQLNVILPRMEERTGLLPVEIRWNGTVLAPPASLRVIPPGPLVPRVVSVSDGVNLLSGTRIETRTVKISFEEVAHPDDFLVTLDGEPVLDLETFCTDPLAQRFEVNFRLTEAVKSGPHELMIHLGRRRYGPLVIEVL